MPSPKTARSAGAQRSEWERLALCVRLALCPDDSRVLQRYLQAGQHLPADAGCPPDDVQAHMLTLLLNTAEDPALPTDWRLLCLDACCRPLAALGALVQDDGDALRLRLLARRLARFSLQTLDHGDPR